MPSIWTWNPACMESRPVPTTYGSGAAKYGLRERLRQKLHIDHRADLVVHESGTEDDVRGDASIQDLNILETLNAKSSGIDWRGWRPKPESAFRLWKEMGKVPMETNLRPCTHRRSLNKPPLTSLRWQVHRQSSYPSGRRSPLARRSCCGSSKP